MSDVMVISSPFSASVEGDLKSSYDDRHIAGSRRLADVIASERGDLAVEALFTLRQPTAAVAVSSAPLDPSGASRSPPPIFSLART